MSIRICFLKNDSQDRHSSTRAPKGHSKVYIICISEPKLFGEPSDYLNFVMRLRRDNLSADWFRWYWVLECCVHYEIYSAGGYAARSALWARF